MKILMLTPYLPYPPASGGQIRTLNLLRYLSSSHEITLIALYKDPSEKKYASYLRAFCTQVYLCKRPEKPWQMNIIAKATFTAEPFLVVRNFSEEAKRLLKRLLKEEYFDVIHAETFYVMPHLPETKVPTLLVEQTIEYKVYQHFVNSLPLPIRPLFFHDIIKLKYWERLYWKKATMVATVSQADKNLLKEVEPDIHTVVIPNGAADEMFISPFPKKDFTHPTLLFMGNFSWLQNIEAAEYLTRKIYPKLEKKLPHCRVIIAGQNASRLSRLRNIDVVDIKASDAKTVKHFYEKSTLFIAPIYGPGGTRLKILTAMASGLPVISTQTGIEGLQVKDDNEVLVANDSDEFVTEIENILKDKKLYGKLQKNAFDHVKKNYSWDAISKQLEVVYRTIRKL